MLTLLVYWQQGNVKNPKQMMKIVDIDKENLSIFKTTWEIPMKFSEKVYLMIILKVAENQGFSHSLENKVLVKPKGGKIDSSQPIIVIMR